MTRYLLLILILISNAANGQALRDINYKYLYNPEESVLLEMKAIRLENTWNILYALKLRDSSNLADRFYIEWQTRTSLSDKEGKVIKTDSLSRGNFFNLLTSGSLEIPISTLAEVFVAKVVNATQKRAWFYYQYLPLNYPANGYPVLNSKPVVSPYINVNTTVSLVPAQQQKIISYYNDNFPAAAPAFSEAMGRVSKSMKVDSTFTVDPTSPIHFLNEGLYLVQADTNGTQGFSFRAEEDYPKLNKIESLADPLIYVCTKNEFERLRQAKGEKRAFDRVILAITGDATRAKQFMRSYFQRVELANQYFTSYKEGWKTDRGMIYIIFGLPKEVYRFTDREVWSYENSLYNISFEFTRSSTLFDLENYVLIRGKRYQESWYEVIDLWRNARF